MASPIRSRLSFRDAFWNVVLPVHLVTTFAIFLNDNFLEITSINGASMSPTLSPPSRAADPQTVSARDYVAWRKWAPTTALRRGDVVLFSRPHNPEGVAVKRVIALPGDQVILDPHRRPKDVLNGRVNPAAELWDRMWLSNRSFTVTGDEGQQRARGAGLATLQSVSGAVRIPEGHVWVEGDNWRDTYDSNSYGPISKSLVKGKALSIVLPWWEFGHTPWVGYKSRTRVLKAEEERRDIDRELRG